MTRNRRVILLTTALLSMSIAVLILSQAGLPERAKYTGTFSESLGWVAPEVDAFAPPIQQPTVDNRHVDLFELRGKPVIINFWATWCEPCKLEMIELQSVYNEFGEEGLHIVGINMGEDPQIVKNWVQEMQLSFDILIDRNGQLSRRYRILGQPSTYLVAPDGMLTNIFYGPVNIAALVDQICHFLVT